VTPSSISAVPLSTIDDSSELELFSVSRVPPLLSWFCPIGHRNLNPPLSADCTCWVGPAKTGRDLTTRRRFHQESWSKRPPQRSGSRLRPGNAHRNHHLDAKNAHAALMALRLSDGGHKSESATFRPSGSITLGLFLGIVRTMHSSRTHIARTHHQACRVRASPFFSTRPIAERRRNAPSEQRGRTFRAG